MLKYIIPILVAMMLMAGCGSLASGNESATHQAQSAVVTSGTSLESVTTLVFGAGQTNTITVTDPKVVQLLIGEMDGSRTIDKPEGTVYFVWLRNGQTTFAHAWLMWDRDNTGDVLGLQIDGQQEWRGVSPGLSEVLTPILRQVSGMNVPYMN